MYLRRFIQMVSTSTQYEAVLSQCKDIFLKKMHDYGTAWRILRVSSITDQIFIKAQRIRSIEEKGMQRVDEGVDTEFLGIINYCVFALIQLETGNKVSLSTDVEHYEMPKEKVISQFDFHLAEAKRLMENKNH